MSLFLDHSDFSSCNSEFSQEVNSNLTSEIFSSSPPRTKNVNNGFFDPQEDYTNCQENILNDFPNSSFDSVSFYMNSLKKRSHDDENTGCINESPTKKATLGWKPHTDDFFNKSTETTFNESNMEDFFDISSESYYSVNWPSRCSKINFNIHEDTNKEILSSSNNLIENLDIYSKTLTKNKHGSDKTKDPEVVIYDYPSEKNGYLYSSRESKENRPTSETTIEKDVFHLFDNVTDSLNLKNINDVEKAKVVLINKNKKMINSNVPEKPRNNLHNDLRDYNNSEKKIPSAIKNDKKNFYSFETLRDPIKIMNSYIHRKHLSERFENTKYEKTLAIYFPKDKTCVPASFNKIISNATLCNMNKQPHPPKILDFKCMSKNDTSLEPGLKEHNLTSPHLTKNNFNDNLNKYNTTHLNNKFLIGNSSSSCEKGNNLFLTSTFDCSNIHTDNKYKLSVIEEFPNKENSNKVKSCSIRTNYSNSKVEKQKSNNISKKTGINPENIKNNSGKRKAKEYMYTDIDAFLKSLKSNSTCSISQLRKVKFALPSKYHDKLPADGYKTFSDEAKETLINYINDTIINPVYELTGFRFVTAASTVTPTKYNRRFMCSQDIASMRKKKSTGQRTSPSRRQKLNQCNSSLSVSYYVYDRTFLVSFKHLTHEPYLEKRVSSEIKQYILSRIDVSPIIIHKELNSSSVPASLKLQASNVTLDQIRWWWSQLKSNMR